MRTTERDQQLAVVRFAAINVTPGASSSGTAQPGNIPWTCVYSGQVGLYTYRFDPAIVPLSVEALYDQGSGGAANTVGYTGLGPGTFQIVTYNNVLALANTKHGWFCTAIDRRR